MQRVTGIGGVFFKARDAQALRAWYKRHLGLDIQSWGGVALPPAPTQPADSKTPRASHSAWCIFQADSDYLGAAPDFWQALTRYVGFFVSVTPLFLGFVWVAFDRRKQAWHDKMARTVVIYRRR